MKILDPALAAKFIEKFSHVFENNINIMDQKGIIIGSKDPSRIGTYHEIAYSLIHKNKTIGDVTEKDTYLGTKEGVNYCIHYKGKPIGVVGISGVADEIRPMGMIVKTSIEAMLEYEFQLETERQQHTRMEQFLYSIIYNESYQPETIHSLAHTLQYKTDCIRIPVLFDCHDQLDPHQMVSLIKQCEESSRQDMIAVLKNNLVLVFKYLKQDSQTRTANYREEIEFFFSSFAQHSKPKLNMNLCSFYIGTMQNSFHYYREAYHHVSWLNLKKKEESGIFFFYDYISEYIKNLATIRVYDELFHVFDSILEKDKQQLFVEIYETLIRHNYNVVTSAKELYIHRNTLLFRMNKMNDLLNLDPISNYHDRELISELIYYYKNK